VAADVQAHERLLLAEEHGDHSRVVVLIRIRSSGAAARCTGHASPDAVVIGRRADFLKRDFHAQDAR
jgi:hypothetical protein